MLIRHDLHCHLQTCSKIRNSDHVRCKRRCHCTAAANDVCGHRTVFIRKLVIAEAGTSSKDVILNAVTLASRSDRHLDLSHSDSGRGIAETVSEIGCMTSRCNLSLKVAPETVWCVLNLHRVDACREGISYPSLDVFKQL